MDLALIGRAEWVFDLNQSARMLDAAIASGMEPAEYRVEEATLTEYRIRAASFRYLATFARTAESPEEPEQTALFRLAEKYEELAGTRAVRRTA